MITRTASELALLCGAVLEGDGERRLVGPASLAEANPDQVSFLRSARSLAELERTRAGAVVVPPGVRPARSDLSLLRCADPSRAFTRVVEAFQPERAPPEPGAHPSAVIAPDAQLGAGVSIGALCVIDAGAEIGPRSVLHAGVVVGRNARVGAECVLHPGVVLYPGVTLGARCIVHAGVVIGSDGFGFEPTAEGWEKIPQTGTVLIGDDVEIGANCAIDRGRFGPTRIGAGAKLDNLVQIGHNVVVGEGALLIAQVGVAGSSRIGARAILAGQVGVSGHVEVGDGAQVAAQSGVSKDLLPGKSYFGSPAKERMQAYRHIASIGKVPDLIERVRALERRLERLEKEET